MDSNKIDETIVKLPKGSKIIPLSSYNETSKTSKTGVLEVKIKN